MGAVIARTNGMRISCVVLTLLLASACSGDGANNGGNGNGGACQVSSDGISLDNAVLSPAANTAYNDCMTGANAASDPYRDQACLMLNLINADRAMFDAEADGAPALGWSEELWVVALGHAVDMCERDFFSHTNPDGESSTDRAERHGVTGDFWVGENILNWPDVESGHAAFMEEPTCTGHRRQILDPKAATVGIGVTQCNGGGNYSVTQNFEVYLNEPGSPYCADDADTACKRPPDVFTSAECTSLCGTADDVDPESWGCSC